VTFDVGGTLVEPWPSVGHVYADVAKEYGLSVDAESLNRQFALAWKAKKDFRHRVSDWFSLVEQTFADLSPNPLSKDLFDAIYNQFATALSWRVFDDVVPCLRELKRRGLKLGLVSNWDSRLRPLLRELDLDGYFDSIVISAEVGSQKPEPGIFRMAAAQLNVPPSSVLHIGDSESEDVKGARAAGLHALLLSRGKPTELPSLDSLPALIR
jgi:putative hydrolase of the HAD superfamily